MFGSSASESYDSNDVESTSGSVGEDKPLNTRLIELNAKYVKFPITDFNIDIPLRHIDAKNSKFQIWGKYCKKCKEWLAAARSE